VIICAIGLFAARPLGYHTDTDGTEMLQCQAIKTNLF
jgi:hypothetical protein